jgi:tetratricopeptide (TPR) repeat protein
LLVAALALAGNGGPSRARHAAQTHRPAPAASAPKSKSPAPAANTHPKPQPPPAPPTADALEARGHGLMVARNYAAAIPVLRQAVAEASPQSLTYAYALFDLGKSYLDSGNPRAAVPILWQRLQIPNQTDVVRTELQLALQELGQRSGGPPGPGHHGQGNGGGQGAGD